MLNADKSQTWAAKSDARNAVFCKAADPFGGFGNMAGGYGFTDPETGLQWKNSEAWYQAQRYIGRPDLQEQIRAQANGWLAKKKAYEFIAETRDDWFDVNVEVMAKAIGLKSSNAAFAKLLFAAEGMQIIELSTRDNFWGARPGAAGVLTGANMLGQLLMARLEKMIAERNAAGGKKKPSGGMLDMLRG